VERWKFLTNHARVLLCIARDPGVRLRDIAAGLSITERSAHAIVADLTAAGTSLSTSTAAATATRSSLACRCPSPPVNNPPSATSSPCSLAAEPGRTLGGHCLAASIQTSATVITRSVRRSRSSSAAHAFMRAAWLVMTPLFRLATIATSRHGYGDN